MRSCAAAVSAASAATKPPRSPPIQPSSDRVGEREAQQGDGRRRTGWPALCTRLMAQAPTTSSEVTMPQ